MNIINFAVWADQRVKLKEGEKNWTNAVEHEEDMIINYSCGPWNNTQETGKETRWTV